MPLYKSQGIVPERKDQYRGQVGERKSAQRVDDTRKVAGERQNGEYDNPKQHRQY
jgi:hypothetical protein